jgi:2-oxo-3-hexenedioate decarboxylase
VNTSSNTLNTLELAEKLHVAAKSATPVTQISIEQSITLYDAYAIQQQLIQKRVEEGSPIIGVKMGFTSEAKMKQMGVSDMIIGLLTQDMWINANGQTERSQFIHPRVEPEICFILSKDITEVLDENQVKEYVEAICPAIELIDSRYQNFKFSLEDVVADNCSSAGFCIGEKLDANTPLLNLPIQLKINDQTVETGNSNDILDNPWKSLAAATRLAQQFHIPLKKGFYVLAGAATSAAFINENQEVIAEIESMPSLKFGLI